MPKQTQDSPVWCTVYKNKILKNLQTIRSKAPGSNVMPILKSNAYGLGAIPLAKLLEAENVPYIGVINQQEALELRKNGINTPILILTETPWSPIESLFSDNLTQTVYTPAMISLLSERAKERKQSLNVHLKIDTGMCRLGCPMNKALELVKLLQNDPYLNLEGIYTHFSNAEENPNDLYNLLQLGDFKTIITSLKTTNSLPKYIHGTFAASQSTLATDLFNLVRVGEQLYRNSFELQTRIAYINHVNPGQWIGYGKTYKSRENSIIAILPIGYSDGIPETLSGQQVNINNRFYPIVGSICMNMTFINLGKNPDALKPQDTVTIYSANENNRNNIPTLSKLTGINPRNFSCPLSQSVKRIYQ